MNVPLVTTPDTTFTRIGPLDGFAVLATDGVWDVVNDQDAVNFVRNQLYMHGDAQKAAKTWWKRSLSVAVWTI